MKIYIAGAITGNKNYKEQFAEAEAHIKSIGHTPISPVTDEPHTYKEYIDRGLVLLSECDAIYMLDGWIDSKGARLEYMYSRTTGIKDYHQGVIEIGECE